MLTLARVRDKLQGQPVQVIARGDSLYLQAVLPDKRGLRKPYQQRLSLGVKNTEIGLNYALGKALELSAALVQKRFSWEIIEGRKTVMDWVRMYQQQKMQSDGISAGTWDKSYLRYYSDGEMVLETAVQNIFRYPANSHQRRRACLAWTGLAKFAGLQWDFASYQGSYGIAKTAKLDIPTDEELLQTAHRSKHSRWWGWYCLQLCYGLRTHEPFFSRLEWDSDLGIWLCRVTEGKTGGRIVYPLPSAWPTELGLSPDMVRPEIRHTTYERISTQACQAYRRLSIPFVPRTLRYAYVIRGIVKLGFSVPEVAGWCGHSPQVLLSTYSRYINAETARDSYRKKAM